MKNLGMLAWSPVLDGNIGTVVRVRSIVMRESAGTVLCLTDQQYGSTKYCTRYF